MTSRNPYAGEPFDEGEAAVAAVLSDVSVPALLCSLVHMIGDPQWIRGPIKPRMGAAFDSHYLRSVPRGVPSHRGPSTNIGRTPAKWSATTTSSAEADADPPGVAGKPIMKAAPLEMGADGVDGDGCYVRQCLPHAGLSLQKPVNGPSRSMSRKPQLSTQLQASRPTIRSACSRRTLTASRNHPRCNTTGRVVVTAGPTQRDR